MRSLEDLKLELVLRLDLIELIDLIELDMNELVELLSNYIEENQEEIEERLGDWESNA